MQHPNALSLATSLLKHVLRNHFPSCTMTMRGMRGRGSNSVKEERLLKYQSNAIGHNIKPINSPPQVRQRQNLTSYRLFSSNIKSPTLDFFISGYHLVIITHNHYFHNQLNGKIYAILTNIARAKCISHSARLMYICSML